MMAWAKQEVVAVNAAMACCARAAQWLKALELFEEHRKMPPVQRFRWAKMGGNGWKR